VPANPSRVAQENRARELLSSAIRTYAEAHPAPRGKAADGVLGRLKELEQAVKYPNRTKTPDKMKMRAFADISNALDPGISLITIMVEVAGYKVEDRAPVKDDGVKVLQKAKAALETLIARAPGPSYREALADIKHHIDLKAAIRILSKRKYQTEIEDLGGGVQAITHAIDMIKRAPAEDRLPLLHFVDLLTAHAQAKMKHTAIARMASIALGGADTTPKKVVKALPGRKAGTTKTKKRPKSKD
jgi:hypothetical protein